MIFEQLVCVDQTGLTPEGYSALQQFSARPIIQWSDYPASDEQIVERLRTADGVLVSWRTPLSAQVLQAASQLKYVGMCCSLYDPLSANVDIPAAQALNIVVRGVRDYGDEGVVEFIMAQLISLYKGLGKWQWGPEPVELKEKHLGLVGFGTSGQLVARAAMCFGMHISYFSRTRRPALENSHIRFLSLADLLDSADVISTHLPRRTYLLGADELSRLKPGSILINTSLGPTFDPAAFCAWIGQGRNHAIFDADGASGYADVFSEFANVIVSDKTAGRTAEAKSRLTAKVIANIREFLAERDRQVLCK